MSVDIPQAPSSSSDRFPQGSQGIEAAQPLDELRLEVLKTRQAVEEIREALGRSSSVYYAPSLAAILQGITQINAELTQIERHPALRFAPADFQRAVSECGHLAMGKAIDQLTETRNALYRTEQGLTSILGHVRSRRQQARSSAIVAVVALISGLVASPLLARVLPFNLDTRIAATVLASDRWEAGVRLLQAADPDSWETVKRATAMWQLNRDPIHACELAAGKSRSSQQCALIITPPLLGVLAGASPLSRHECARRLGSPVPFGIDDPLL